VELAGHADACDRHRQPLAVGGGAVLDARVQDGAKRRADGRDDEQADDAERLHQGEPRKPHAWRRVGRPRRRLEVRPHERTHVRRERRGSLAPHG
jgi:hypothetical protein